MNILINVANVEVPIDSLDDNVIIAIDGVDVAGIDFMDLDVDGTFTVGTWPDGEVWQRIATIRTTKDNAWDDDEVQFARLLCEIAATIDYDDTPLLESMDLTREQLAELFQRANNTWEQAKEARRR